MRHKAFGALLRRDLFSLSLNPAARASGIFFTLFCFINFFILRRFFVPLAGSTDMRSFFAPMPLISILCIPAVTMSLWTAYDFYTVLPVSSFMRTLSKWLSALIFLSFFLLVSAAAPFAASFFGTVEYSVVCTGYIGILCAFSAMIAIAQALSLVCRSKPLAFLLSALVFSFTALIHRGAALSSHSGVQALMRFLSFSRHFDAAGKGIIDSRDILFYLCVTLLFLSISAFIVEYGRYSASSKNPHKKALFSKYTALFLLYALVLWNSRIFYGRTDLTRGRSYSLSEASREAVSILHNRLTISYYVSSELAYRYPAIDDVKEFLYNYADISKDIAVRIVRVKTDTEKKAAQDSGVFPQILENAALSGGGDTAFGGNKEALSVYSGIVLEYKAKKSVIPFVLTPFDAEFAIADMLPLITQDSSPAGSHARRSVGVLIANGLSLEADYPYLTQWLEAAGFAVRILEPAMLESLSDFSGFGGEAEGQTDTSRLLPHKEPLLIVGSSALNEAQCESLDAFLASGGSLLCAVSAHEADLHTWELKPLAQNPFLSLLEKYGISVQNPIVADASCASIRMLRQQSGGGTQSGIAEAYEEIDYPFFVQIRTDNAEKTDPLCTAFGGLDLFWPSYIRTDTTDTTVLAHTSVLSRLQEPLDNAEKAYNTNPFFAADFMPKEEHRGFPVVCAADTAYKDGFSGARIIAVADQYFLSRMVEYTGAFYNFDFAVNALLRLSGEQGLLSIKNRAFTDYRVKAPNSAEFAQKARITLICLFLWCCAAFGVFFILVRFYRKKHAYAPYAVYSTGTSGSEKPPFTPQNGRKRGKNA
ncbi:Gldg family protein [Treponema sp. OMZ 840]|uniref:Gldg family protein n=1 Tax=Treponema sp. OMZ 840 TaxID=244313 RepID=UPI003D8B36C3